MKCEALANISRVMTNERSFSVVNASAPVGTTDKFFILLAWCSTSFLPHNLTVVCHHFTICSAKASQLVRSKLIVC